ncbi:MAG: hypothetical protein J6U22_02950 [Bacteroidaceae bacterium]|nr:hypothetical protein [Bacteroidaceae bacterium]
MLIIKKRINAIDKYIAPFKDEEGLYVATEINSDEFVQRLKDIGFPEVDFTGIKLIPKAIGPVSSFNAEGRDELLKDLPMETYYRDAYIKDWHGYYHYVDIPGERYQRNHIDGPCQEISLITIGEKKYAISDYIPNTPESKELIKHVVNLFLEIFGVCIILDKKKCPLVSTTSLRRANWQILPEGEIVWARVNELAGNIQDSSELVGQLQIHRFMTIMKYKPDCVYYGNGGFHGYLVFVFKSKNLVLMENMIYGNATYVFHDNWEELSKLSKAEIIQNNLHDKRLVHRESWPEQIKSLLK